MFCISILSPIVIIVRTLIQIARQIVRTVCDWVSSTITVVKTIVEEVCKWLPWPLNKLCDLVTRVIEVIETVWNWVCHDVLETILDGVEIIVEYIRLCTQVDLLGDRLDYARSRTLALSFGYYAAQVHWRMRENPS